MKHLSILVAAIFAAACSSVFDPQFKPEYDRGNIPMTYVKVKEKKELQAICGAAAEKLGCAVQAADKCTVVTYETFPEEVGHFEKHCRYGKWHD